MSTQTTNRPNENILRLKGQLLEQFAISSNRTFVDATYDTDGLVPSKTYNTNTLEMQEKLSAMGFNLNPAGKFKNNGVDGFYGNTTKAAIAKFQIENAEKYGLKLDKNNLGVADPETLKAIEQGYKARGVEYKPATPSAAGDVIDRVKTEFNRVAQGIRDVVSPQLTTQSTDPRYSKLLDFIAKPESRGNYNIVYGGKTHDLTNMTINEVRALQKQMVADGSPSSAAGRYQIIGKTMDGLVKSMGLTGNEKFSPEMQDKMAIKLMEGRGLNAFMTGKLTEEQFIRNLSKEWASLPKDASNKGFYDGDGLNKSLVSFNDLRRAVATLFERDPTTTLASAGPSPTGRV